ncbi:adenylosuccinate lyase [Candidatus Woesearchaeota archaeon]|nr:adenylosuccinate lyase [Candidatus Woesearchaeota archaeon]
MVNENVFSERYVTPEINAIFSTRGKILDERNFWILVMKLQKILGQPFSSEDIEKYEQAKEDINLKLIKKIERGGQHDVKARIEAFVQAAGAKEIIHVGMTSRDLTDNVEQWEYKRASEIILGRYVAVLKHMVGRANDYRDIYLTGRTHHQAAETTLLGRRMAMWAEELRFHIEQFEAFIPKLPLRGIKGPIGTQADMRSILGSQEAVDLLETAVAKHLGFKEILYAPGQVYPRSLDFALVSHLAFLSSACENYAIGMRLMAGYELVTEGFKAGQTGSTAMPHKMNTRSSERIWAAAEALKMYADGGSRISGATWEEGDVSDSLLRRVIGPDAFYASDTVCETTMTVLQKMGAYPIIISQEVDRYLQFMATPEILSTAVKAGLGREQAH